MPGKGSKLMKFLKRFTIRNSKVDPDSGEKPKRSVWFRLKKW